MEAAFNRLLTFGKAQCTGFVALTEISCAAAALTYMAHFMRSVMQGELTVSSTHLKPGTINNREFF